MQQLIRFCLVGGVGFLIDAAVLEALYLCCLDPFVARLFSYVAAATGTWLLNRRFTFVVTGRRDLFGEWLRYLTANGFGWGVNYAAFVASFLTLDPVRAHPVLGVAIGSAAAIGVNFLANKYLVFRNAEDSCAPPTHSSV